MHPLSAGRIWQPVWLARLSISHVCCGRVFLSRKGGWGMGEGFRVGEVLHPEGISVYVNQRQPRWGRKHCLPRPVHTQPCGSPTAHQSQGRPLGNLQPCACPFARPSWSRSLVEVAQRRLIERHGSCFGDGDGFYAEISELWHFIADVVIKSGNPAQLKTRNPRILLILPFLANRRQLL